MNISLNAEVHCTDGVGGHSIALVLNPVTRVATHVVVKIKGHEHDERLLPLDFITGGAADRIGVRCSRDELGQLEPFMKAVRVQETGLDRASAQALMGSEGQSGLSFQDFSFAGAGQTEVIEEEAIPETELAVRHGIPVEATDHTVGRVEEFDVNLQTGEIMFLVLKEGHLLKKEVPVPVDQIDRIGEEAVHLKLTKDQVESLRHV